jgi:hypothetical protein
MLPSIWVLFNGAVSLGFDAFKPDSNLPVEEELGTSKEQRIPVSFSTTKVFEHTVVPLFLWSGAVIDRLLGMAPF